MKSLMFNAAMPFGALAMMLHACESVALHQVPEQQSKSAEDQEPVRMLELTIDGQAVLLEIDTETSVQINGTTKRIRVAEHAVRTLKVQHLTFEYPTNFYFEAKMAREPDEFSKWDLKGRWVKLSLQRMTDAGSFAEYVAAMQDVLTSDDGTRKVTKVEPITEKLGGRTITGTRIHVFVAPDAAVQVDHLDLLEVDKCCRYVLVISYSPEDGSKEAMIVRRLLRDSMKYY